MNTRVNNLSKEEWKSHLTALPPEVSLEICKIFNESTHDEKSSSTETIDKILEYLSEICVAGNTPEQQLYDSLNKLRSK